MSLLTLASIVLALTGAFLCYSGIRCLLQRRPLAALNRELIGLLLLLLAGVSFLLASNLYLYDRLVFEAPVAEIEFTRLDDQHFLAELDYDAGMTPQRYDMHGDEWRLEAQMLLWHGYASLLGLDAQYRLHRLSGRYTQTTDELELQRSVHALGEEPKLDLWQVASRHHDIMGVFVDAAYGSAVFLPMSDAARYQISISRSGLVARPMNESARQAVSHWIGL
ncbi:MAG: cation/multidrug efflux pump [Gammaproteobacteria bacterium]